MIHVLSLTLILSRVTVGFVVDIKDCKSHDVVRQELDILILFDRCMDAYYIFIPALLAMMKLIIVRSIPYGIISGKNMEKLCLFIEKSKLLSLSLSLSKSRKVLILQKLFF